MWRLCTRTLGRKFRNFLGRVLAGVEQRRLSGKRLGLLTVDGLAMQKRRLVQCYSEGIYEWMVEWLFRTQRGCTFVLHIDCKRVLPVHPDFENNRNQFQVQVDALATQPPPLLWGTGTLEADHQPYLCRSH